MRAFLDFQYGQNRLYWSVFKILSLQKFSSRLNAVIFKSISAKRIMTSRLDDVKRMGGGVSNYTSVQYWERYTWIRLQYLPLDYMNLLYNEVKLSFESKLPFLSENSNSIFAEFRISGRNWKFLLKTQSPTDLGSLRKMLFSSENWIFRLISYFFGFVKMMKLRRIMLNWVKT